MGPSTIWLERAVDHLDIALLLIAPDRRVSYANAAAHRLFGVRAGQLEGATLDRLTVPERRGEIRNIDEVLAGGAARKVRSVIRREDGARVDVTMIVEPCFDEGSRVVAASIRYESVVHLGRPSLMPRAQPTTAPPAATSSSLPPPTASARPAVAAHPASPPSSVPDAGSHVVSTFAPQPARNSGLRFNSVPDAASIAARLERVLRNQRWLEERLSVPPSVAALDDSRERARALMVVTESRKLLQEALEGLGEPGEQKARIPL